VIQEHRHETASGLLECIVKEVKTFAGGMAQADDMTLLIVKRK